MADVIEVNASTGEIIERSFTQDELNQLKQDKIHNEEVANQLKEQYDLEVEKRNNSIQKFINMGFSEEEANSFVPIINPDYRIFHLL
jgi:3-oxoacyl-ACP reductase-like protein